MSREAIKCVPFSAQEHQRVIEFDAPAKDKEKQHFAFTIWLTGQRGKKVVGSRGVKMSEL